jgi:hypothetical protein
VIDTSEFRSSKLCSKCFGLLSDRAASGAVLNWGVRRCNNTECSTLWWHCDVNAARNIGRAFFCAQRDGRSLPQAFLRSSGSGIVDGSKIMEINGEEEIDDDNDNAGPGKLRGLPA